MGQGVADLRPLLRLVQALVVGFVALRIASVFVLPFGPTIEHGLEGLNDEPAHYRYAMYLSLERELPTQVHSVRTPGAFQRYDFEFYQPPLYYALSAALLTALGDSGGRVASRLLSCVFGLLSLLVLFRIFAALALPERLQWAGVLWVAALPPHVYFCSVVSNDALSWLLCLLILAECLRLEHIPGRPQQSADHWRAARFTGLIAAGLLTKTSVGLLVPVVVLAYGRAYFERRDRAILAELFAVMAISALLAAPWYARNVVVYGSLLALEVGAGPPMRDLRDLTEFSRFVGTTLRFFWLPMQQVPGPSLMGGLTAVVGLLVVLHTGAAVRFVPGDLLRRRGMALLVVLLACTVAAYLAYNRTWVHGEARLLYPALPALALFFVAPPYLFLRHVGAPSYLLPYVISISVLPYLALLRA